mmetsp:Transcript_30924/g.71273  ORF Transcript_30924/g.71273 Transcript_30924/m.71273 type:complete len:96 (-) Transcript_30924:404-691(-)
MVDKCWKNKSLVQPLPSRATTWLNRTKFRGYELAPDSNCSPACWILERFTEDETAIHAVGGAAEKMAEMFLLQKETMKRLPQWQPCATATTAILE